MAYSQPFLKLTFGGFQAAGQDIWTCGVNLAITHGEAVQIIPENAVNAFNAYAEDINDDIVSIFSNYISASVMDIPRGASLNWIKLAVIGTDGQYLADSQTWEVADVTGSVNRAYIPQVSLVMTLASNKRADPGKYQRFYLPTAVPAGFGYRPTGLADKAERTAMLIAALQRRVRGALIDYEIYPAAVTSSPKHTGDYLPITRVRVGDVFDTQRRRRNKIGETYDEVAVDSVEVPDPVPVP